MKIIIKTLVFLVFSNSFAQDICKKRTLNDLEKTIIKEYIGEATKGRWFKNDIGVVYVNEDLSQLPYFRWDITLKLDDQIYLDSTSTYANYYSDLIIFKTNSKEKVSSYKGISGCWSEIIGDRLYIKPLKQNRLYKQTFDGWEDGKPILDENKQIRVVSDRGRRSYFDGDPYFIMYQFSLEKGVVNKSRMSTSYKKFPK